MGQEKRQSDQMQWLFYSQILAIFGNQMAIFSSYFENFVVIFVSTMFGYFFWLFTSGHSVSRRLAIKRTSLTSTAPIRWVDPDWSLPSKTKTWRSCSSLWSLALNLGTPFLLPSGRTMWTEWSACSCGKKKNMSMGNLTPGKRWIRYLYGRSTQICTPAGGSRMGAQIRDPQNANF